MKEPTATIRRNNEQTNNNMYAIIRLNQSAVREDGFYIDSAHTPSRLHKTIEDAEIEAKRLAAKHPNVFFGIFHCEKAAVSTINPVQLVKL